tara:strand:- start:133 stop:642 length:510 start_codon:yes stop_codon:yes gene_type:complete
MADKDYSGTRKNVSKTMLGNLAETLGFKKGLSYKQLMTEAASLSQKAVKQGLKRAGWKGAAALAAIEAVGYGASKLMSSKTDKNKPTTKSKTKTYAEMVKEDKAKGKNKVLSRRAPETPPRKPKKLRDKPVEKKKPIIKKKVVKKKVEEKQLYMKKDGKNTLVKFKGDK